MSEQRNNQERAGRPDGPYDANFDTMIDLVGDIHVQIRRNHRTQHPRSWEHVSSQEAAIAAMRELLASLGGTALGAGPETAQLTSPQERAAIIARLNDEFRKRGPNEDWVATVGATELSDFPGLVQAVMDYDDFSPDTDPYGEHDMGRIMWQEEKAYWKIDYYDQHRQSGEDPLSHDCRRVMTILLASEY